MQKEISRREALKLGALGVGAGVLGASNLMAMPLDAKDVKFDEEYDVVIIGSGFAGLAAGITAAKRGFKTLIVEKMGRLGGNSVINGGIFAVPNNEAQKKEGIKDSNELFLKDCLKAGLQINHTELLETIANRAKDVFALTVKCGAKYVEKLSHAGGHSVPRTYQTANGSGSGIVLPMIEYIEKIQML